MTRWVAELMCNKNGAEYKALEAVAVGVFLGGGYCGFCSCGYKKFAITWR